MVQRCTNPKSDVYKWYGGRGISVCERWKSFENFLADMGERPSGKTLDRFPDNNGNYEPGNCRWATRKEQMNNTRGMRRLEYCGKEYSMSELSRHTGVPLNTLRRRIDKYGWSVERSISIKLKFGQHAPR